MICDMDYFFLKKIKRMFRKAEDVSESYKYYLKTKMKLYQRLNYAYFKRATFILYFYVFQFF